MGQCGYLYPHDGARCMYDDHRLVDGDICMEHREVMRKDEAVRKMNAKNKAARDQARREKQWAMWEARVAEVETRRGMMDGQATG